MLATINTNNSKVTIDLSKPLDISIVMSDSPQNPLAWYLEKPEISAEISGFSRYQAKGFCGLSDITIEMSKGFERSIVTFELLVLMVANIAVVLQIQYTTLLA